MSHYNYSKAYTSDLLRGRDITTRPFLTQQIAKNYGGANKKLLDIGCGTAQKSLSMLDAYHTLIGIEPSQDLLQIACENILKKNSKHCFIIEGIADQLPFKPNTFDVTTSILSWWNAAEINKILKPNGIFLLECLGPDDKTTFTRFFGKDDQGWRGANLNTNLQKMEQKIKEKLIPYFKMIEIKNLTWQTQYSKEGLWLLVNNTRTTVRNFHPINDKNAFDEAFNQLQDNDCVVLTQNRLVVIAQKI